MGEAGSEEGRVTSHSRVFENRAVFNPYLRLTHLINHSLSVGYRLILKLIITLISTYIDLGI